ncbi:MAG TPA: DegT/DnrJ/EryC1/StrS family aminotransferase [Chthoniobacterales bacterium]
MKSRNKIPFLDLVAPHVELEDELVSVFRSALRSASFIGGPPVQNFEQAFASFCERNCCIGVGSGTDALRFGLVAAGVAAGDSVLTVPHTFIATTEAISQAGALPEFIDIDSRTYTMDPNKLREYLESRCTIDPESGKPVSSRTGRKITGIVPVHLYGHMADMDSILALARRYNLIVIEDACQAHGAEYFSEEERSWKKAGSMGVAAAFSFYPGKNLGACGEAGAVTCNDEGLAHKIRMLRDHGQSRKYHHSIEGYNGRLDAIQAGVLLTKLAYLSEWNESRRQAAERYAQLFSSSSHSVVLPSEASWSRAVYHLYVIRSDNRDQLRNYLAEAGVDTGIHYPIPLHLQDAYRHLGYAKGDFPISEQAAAEVVSLPMFPRLLYADQRSVVDAIAAFVTAAIV